MNSCFKYNQNIEIAENFLNRISYKALKRKTMSKIKLLLVDDHSLFRAGIKALLEKEKDIEIVGEAENGREAVKKAKQLSPDIVLMDISMPSLNGIEATHQIKKNNIDTKVLIVTMHEAEEYISKALHAGAYGYLTKSALHAELIAAIKAVHQGEYFLSPQITKKLITRFVNKSNTKVTSNRLNALTEREREIIQLIAEGNSNKKIAEILYISKKTVENHRTNLMKKLDIHNVVELTQFAIRNGLISTQQM